MKKTTLLFIVNLLLIIGSMACGPIIRNADQPNIVWITSEDNSKHYLKLFDENGIATPHIEALAQHGLTFDRAFSNAPVCSAARSTLISGCYGPRMASHYHRKLEMVPMPEGVEMFPVYLKRAGYYTTNNSKEDYNIIKSEDVWDESSKSASWRNRGEEQPFFHVFNIATTHESRLHFTEKQMNKRQTTTDPGSFTMQPNHPQTELYRYTNAYYRDKIVEMDHEVGEIISELEKDGLLENTFVFYFGDHGGVLPGSKGYIYETGLHVPLVVYVPEKYKKLVDFKIGSRVDGFVSFVDFGPTVLELAGAELPEGMDGVPFLGKNIRSEALNSRDETYSYADRFDEKYDMVRALRKGRYKYIRSYQPFNFDGLMNNYRYIQLAYGEWASLYHKGELNRVQSQFFEPRAPEELFDITADPFETINLAKNIEYKEVLEEMRLRLDGWVSGLPDLSFYPEHFLKNKAFNNPVKFGQAHKADIRMYIDIANLALQDFNEVEQKIVSVLQSEDPWERYWGLIVCSSFAVNSGNYEDTGISGDTGKSEDTDNSEIDENLKELVKWIAKNDKEIINRVRAAEFLGITGEGDPCAIIADALYDSRDGGEALLILNSAVLMRDGFNYSIDIQLEKMSEDVKENSHVQRRILYLNL